MSAIGKLAGIDTDKIAHDWLPVAERAVSALEKFVDAYAAQHNSNGNGGRHERTTGRGSKTT